MEALGLELAASGDSDNPRRPYRCLRAARPSGLASLSGLATRCVSKVDCVLCVGLLPWIAVCCDILAGAGLQHGQCDPPQKHVEVIQVKVSCTVEGPSGRDLLMFGTYDVGRFTNAQCSSDSILFEST